MIGGRSVPTFMLHVFAAMAQEERRLISVRTRDALAAAKARGKQLGTHGKVLAKRNAEAASARDAAMESGLRRTAHLPLRAAAAELGVSFKTVARARARLGLVS